MTDMTRLDFMKAGMATRGWVFTETGPHAWEWIKDIGVGVFRGGSDEWFRDLETVTFSADQRFK